MDHFYDVPPTSIVKNNFKTFHKSNLEDGKSLKFQYCFNDLTRRWDILRDFVDVSRRVEKKKKTIIIIILLITENDSLSITDRIYCDVILNCIVKERCICVYRENIVATVLWAIITLWSHGIISTKRILLREKNGFLQFRHCQQRIWWSPEK